jgi:AcrR family transcriptional regulator
MSSQSKNGRKYELKQRAESQERTRKRIAKAAAELHERVGPAATTVAEIARRAGVSRLTVYKHFPDSEALYPACSAHYMAEHPLPDFGGALAIDDPIDRVRSVLDVVYRGIFRERRPLLQHLFRDRGSDPALDEFMGANLDALLGGLASTLGAGLGATGREAGRLQAIVGLALDFWTWDRLVDEGLGDEGAAQLMTDAIAAVAGAAKPAPLGTR